MDTIKTMVLFFFLIVSITLLTGIYLIGLWLRNHYYYLRQPNQEAYSSFLNHKFKQLLLLLAGNMILFIGIVLLTLDLNNPDSTPDQALGVLLLFALVVIIQKWLYKLSQP